jgi:hypothetical protein
MTLVKHGIQLFRPFLFDFLHKLRALVQLSPMFFYVRFVFHENKRPLMKAAFEVV